MNSNKRTTLKLISLALAVAAGLPAAGQAHGLPGFAQHPEADRGGVVYVMSNASIGNEIFVFGRDRRGRLHALPGRTTPTGGLGGSDNAAIDPLGSQNALVYDDDSGLLFAVNAGDDSVSVLGTGPGGTHLRLLDVAPSGGFIPVSVAVDGRLLYVLNAGGSGSVSTFEIGADGSLSALGAYDLGLSNATSIPFDNVLAPGQVGVDALARRLIVTHAGGQEMLAIDLDDDGLPSAAIQHTPAPGIVPFSFDVTPHGSVLVSEAGSGSVSAYDVPPAGQPLDLTAASVPTGQAASCWILAHDAGFAFVANTGSNTLSSFVYTRHGGLALLEQVAASAGGAPTDMSFAAGQRFLYTLDAAGGSISGFEIDASNGSLTAVWTQGGLPAAAGLQGIAARDL